MVVFGSNTMSTVRKPESGCRSSSPPASPRGEPDLVADDCLAALDLDVEPCALDRIGVVHRHGGYTEVVWRIWVRVRSASSSSAASACDLLGTHGRSRGLPGVVDVEHDGEIVELIGKGGQAVGTEGGLDLGIGRLGLRRNAGDEAPPS